MLGSKNRPSLARILLLFLVCSKLICYLGVQGSEVSQSPTGASGYDGSVQNSGYLGGVSEATEQESIFSPQEVSPQPDSKTLGDLSISRATFTNSSPEHEASFSGAGLDKSKTPRSRRLASERFPTSENSVSRMSKEGTAYEKSFGERSRSRSSSKSGSQERSGSPSFGGYSLEPSPSASKRKGYASPSELYPPERSRSRSSSRSSSRSKAARSERSTSKSERSRSKSGRERSKSRVSTTGYSIPEPSVPESISPIISEQSGPPETKATIPLVAPDISAIHMSPYFHQDKSGVSISEIEPSSSPLTLNDRSVPQETSVSSPESSSLLSEEASPLAEGSQSPTRMPSRKSSGSPESTPMRPFSPVDEGSESSTLLDGSLSADNPLDLAQLPTDVASESTVGSNYMTLLSSLYGAQALSGVPPEFSEELFRIEIILSETLYNSGLSISNADITLFTKRVILEDSPDNVASFGAKLDPNFFEKVPHFPRATFNFLECVYQLENILFHTRSFVQPVSMAHILKGCDNLRTALNIPDPIMNNKEIFSKAVQYLVLRIYNINNDEIIDIITNRIPIPAILDPKAFEKLENSLVEDFVSDSGSLPLAIEFWRVILLQQLKAFDLYSNDLADRLLDEFGLLDILIDAMYSDPIRMCPYISSVVFFKVSPFKIEDIRINSAKIQTFCLIYLKNVGLDERVVLDKFEMPSFSRNQRLDKISSQLAPGFGILPYFHPSFPKNGKDLTWETCYSVYSSVSLMLNSMKDDLIFPQISPLCTKITKESPTAKFVLGMFSRILDIPSTIQNDLLEIRSIDQLISALTTKIRIPETHLREIYTDYILGNPVKYLNTVYAIFAKSIQLYSGIGPVDKSKTSKSVEQLYLTRDVSEGTQMFQRLLYWSSIHLYFLSFTMRVPNSSEILGGIYSFTPSNCESLLFSFLRRVSYSTRSSIVDSLTLCMTMYSVINKNYVSPVLVKNSSLQNLKDALNYKIGTWAPTQNEWMRSIYMVFETKLEIIPNISNIQTLSFSINEDFFNCFYSVNKYLHGMTMIGDHRGTSNSSLRSKIPGDRVLGFNLCSFMSVGAHSTREEALELRIISTVIESIRQFGFKIGIEPIKEFIEYYRNSNKSAFPSGKVIMDHVVSKFPSSLGIVMKKAFQLNQLSSNLPPYFILAEEAIIRSLESRGCSIRTGEPSYSEQSFELSKDTSASLESMTSLYYNTINACLSWKTFGYFNLISCYSALINAGACESSETVLEVLVQVAEQLEWPKELILLNLSQDFSLSDSQVFQRLKQTVDQEEFEKYVQIAQDLIIYVEEHVNGFSWSEKSLTDPKSISPILSESSLEVSRTMVEEINYSFAFGFIKDSMADYSGLWGYRREVVLKQIQNFPVDPSLRLTPEEISSLVVDHPIQHGNKQLDSNAVSYINQLKELCYKEPYGAFLCEINPQLGLPPLRIVGGRSKHVSTSISVMTPPAETPLDKDVGIMIYAPSGSSARWEELRPQSLLFLSVILGQRWKKEYKVYRDLSVKYFPFSGELIRLTPPVFKLEIKESESIKTSEQLDSSLSSSVSASVSPAKISRAQELPGIWHEYLGSISIYKLVEFSRFVPDNSHLLIKLAWTLASALNSLWEGGVELCSIDLRSIYVYTGSHNQQNLNTGRILNEFLDFGPDEENVHTLTNFILHTISTPLIRFGDLGRSRRSSGAEFSESSHSRQTECDDRRDLVRILKEILNSSDELSGRITGESLEDICKEISEIDPTKLDCSALAWADSERTRLPNDLDKWPITDIMVVTPALRPSGASAPTTLPGEMFSEDSRLPEESAMFKGPGEQSILVSAPTSVPVSVSEQFSVLAPSPGGVEPSEVAESSQKVTQNPQVPDVSPSSEESERTSSKDIFDQATVRQEDSSASPLNHKMVAPPPVEKQYRPGDLNEFTVVKVPKGQLLSLKRFPKVQGTLSEKRIFEIKELLTAMKGVVEDLVSKFTSWSASASGRHSPKVPDLDFKPAFIFVPPTPNNRPDSPKILEKGFYIHESVFLFAREELQRMELPLQREGDKDLVEVMISRAGLSSIRGNQGVPNAIPDIRPEISPISQVSQSSVKLAGGQEISSISSPFDGSKDASNPERELQTSSDESSSLEDKTGFSPKSGGSDSNMSLKERSSAAESSSDSVPSLGRKGTFTESSSELSGLERPSSPLGLGGYSSGAREHSGSTQGSEEDFSNVSSRSESSSGE
ncbi:signal peptide-containing protein [Cryptosporidium canis]|uniref:Signal peptide-containing protein n=1 Tax=Cryptosporidium canis TaxID=195482 RepID=A0A9D5DI85_9CRYT|nr:signal peptide-containing protein [Cryptosporidium canis]